MTTYLNITAVSLAPGATITKGTTNAGRPGFTVPIVYTLEDGRAIPSHSTRERKKDVLPSVEREHLAGNWRPVSRATLFGGLVKPSASAFDSRAMKTTELESLAVSKTYRVRVRNFDGGKHIPSKAVLRIFLGTEIRFGSILCAVFSSALRRGRTPCGELSVPHYDLLEAVAQ